MRIESNWLTNMNLTANVHLECFCVDIHYETVYKQHYVYLIQSQNHKTLLFLWDSERCLGQYTSGYHVYHNMKQDPRFICDINITRGTDNLWPGIFRTRISRPSLSAMIILLLFGQPINKLTPSHSM